MNAPQLYERFKIPDGKRRVEAVADTKVLHAATFTIMGEDHTLGNVIRMELIADPNVLFIGYQIPHPLMHELKLRVRALPVLIHTTGKDRVSGKPCSPEDALNQSLQNLQEELSHLLGEFTKKVDEAQRNAAMFSA